MSATIRQRNKKPENNTGFTKSRTAMKPVDKCRPGLFLWFHKFLHESSYHPRKLSLIRVSLALLHLGTLFHHGREHVDIAFLLLRGSIATSAVAIDQLVHLCLEGKGGQVSALGGHTVGTSGMQAWPRDPVTVLAHGIS